MKMSLTGMSKNTSQVEDLIPLHIVGEDSTIILQSLKYATQQKHPFIYSNGGSTWFIDTTEFHTLKLSFKSD